METLKLCTRSMREYDYKRADNLGVKADGSDWTFPLLSVLMNELEDFKFDPKNSCRSRKHYSGSLYTFMRLQSIKKRDHYILINIDNIITVKVLLFSEKDTKESWFTNFWVIQIKLSRSKILLSNAPLIYYYSIEFSSLFHSFEASFVDNKVSPLSDNTDQIYKFFDCFLSSSNNKKVNLESFKEETKGCLKLYLTENNNTGKFLDTFSIEEKNYFILGGNLKSMELCSTQHGMSCRNT